MKKLLCLKKEVNLPGPTLCPVKHATISQCTVQPSFLPPPHAKITARGNIRQHQHGESVGNRIYFTEIQAAIHLQPIERGGCSPTQNKHTRLPCSQAGEAPLGGWADFIGGDFLPQQNASAVLFYLHAWPHFSLPCS